MKHGILLLTAALLCFPLIVDAGKGYLSYPPVTGFDLQRYLGTWYEIARMPASFENGLCGVTATYSLRPDGKVKVLNQGRKGSLTGPRSTATGKAKFAGDPATAHLKVSFFGPFYADYIVVELGPEYSYALVISSSEYAWILSRTPVLDQQILTRLVEKTGSLGIDTSRLIMTPQE
jgi:apolipoprotein D and lipocalin family protein